MFDTRSPNEKRWLNTPINPQDWPLASAPPDKRSFIDFLEQELDIHDFDRQRSLWDAIAFSSSWLLLDEIDRPDNRKVRRRLVQLKKHTDELLIAMSATPDEEHSRKAPPSRYQKVDSWIVRKLEARRAPQSAKELEGIRSNLKLLKLILKQSEDSLRHSHAGRRKDEILWTWVEHLQPIWSLTTQRPATVDHHDGEPVTPYAMFMHRAIAMLDPERASRLESILVRHRTQQNRTESGPDYNG